MSKLHFFKFLLMLADHLDEDSFKICYIDTDSVLLAYTSETLDGIVKDGKVLIVFSLFHNNKYVSYSLENFIS